MPSNNAGKTSPGAEFRAPPAVIWNNMVDAGRAWADSQLNNGVPSPTRPRRTDLIKIRNDSGADRERGEILAITDKAITDLTDETIWLVGDTPTADGYFAILKEPIQNGETGTAQVSGCCMALVDVIDIDHTRAKPSAGDYILESADDGPIEILYSPGSTGEVECVVRFGGGGGGGGNWGAVIKTPSGGITGRSGTTVYSGSCDVFSIVGTTLTDTGINIDVYNLSTGPVAASVFGTAKREYATGLWVIDMEECPTGY